MSEELFYRFRNGLIELGLNPDIVKDTWRYAGGKDIPYFKTFWGTTTPFPHKDRCVCKQKIKNNYYISPPDKSNHLVLGSCCIKKFIDKRTQTCDICLKPHRNRKDNFCDFCRHKLLRDREKELSCMAKEDMLLHNDRPFSFQDGSIKYSSTYRNLFLTIEKANKSDQQKQALKQYFMKNFEGRTISHYLFLRLK